VERPWKLAIVSACLLTTGTLAALRGRSGIALSSINVGDRCQTTATVLVPARGEPRGTAIVVHGLAGNRAVMVGLAAVLARAGWQVYVPDLAGHGNSQMRFGYEQAEQCLAQAITAIAGHSRNPGALLLVGHSLGGALVLRVGSAARASATIALSPAPLVPPARFPPRLLIITGNLDLPWVRQNTRQLAAWLKNDSNQHNPGPCADRIEWVAPATHASVLFDPRVWKAVLQWSACAQPGMPAVADADSAGAAWLQAGTLLGSLGILLLFPLLFRLLGPPIKLQPKVSAPPVPTRRLLASWATAVGLVVCIVGLTGLNQHIRPVRLADGSWLAWVSGLTGGVLMLLLPACRVREGWQASRLLLSGTGTTLLLACLIKWISAWLATGAAPVRFLEAAVLAVSLFPYCLAEEAVLASSHRRQRWVGFAALRGLAWAALAFSVFVFNGQGLILFLLTLVMALLSAGQRATADVLLREGWGVPAAAVASSLIGVSIALWLPLSR
jgi:dienelactone hydrolase